MIADHHLPADDPMIADLAAVAAMIGQVQRVTSLKDVE
jgi:hypothetical protein